MVWRPLRDDGGAVWANDSSANSVHPTIGGGHRPSLTYQQLSNTSIALVDIIAIQNNGSLLSSYPTRTIDESLSSQ